MALDLVTNLNDVLWTYLITAFLIAVGIYFTIRTNFVQVRYIGQMFKLLREGTKRTSSVSSFQAFCISTAARVGTGNIAGVALAITMGGPGAVFWMWIIALMGAASAFIEATLAQIFKKKDAYGFRGGPAYYMEQGLGKRWPGVVFSILITISFGLVFNSVQANTITAAFESSFGWNKLTMGIIIAITLGFIIFGGVKRIARISEIMVPIMAGGYVLLALYVVLTNITLLPDVFETIVSSAFGWHEASGGMMGAAVMWGIKRGLFSNEAGMGSAPNAAATADVTHPVKQGLIQSLGVFVDTLLICSSTAFIVLIAGNYTNSEQTGIVLAQESFNALLGPWAGMFLTLAILLFAYSSLIGNYYYGETNIEFLKGNKNWLLVYRLAVLGMVLFGSLKEVALIWNLADLFMGFMALVNLIAISILGKYAFAALKDYSKQSRAGVNPVFRARNMHGLENVECWQDDDEEKSPA
ncbi:alanine:cation symporter family protein [Paenibacillus sp. N1-5-1-14]|uniref:alanine/glycine:cation symporter family protein n=1 Tax=Paenibacillus radicibacter TaxID=2972488 RepID=UPI0021598C1E|nr:alanine/glycine:cation symporter family protein [Paenibacillus radicibacter]MCR8642787.1 alanine:cation symporter family protein [Paenibacillus radicibacter]